VRFAYPAFSAFCAALSTQQYQLSRLMVWCDTASVMLIVDVAFPWFVSYPAGPKAVPAGFTVKAPARPSDRAANGQAGDAEDDAGKLPGSLPTPAHL
jgi:hypothetical protein